MGARRPHADHVRRQRRAVRPRPIRQRAQQLGHQHRRRRGALHVLLGLPRHRGPYSLQASWKPIDWICLADGLLWALIVLSEDYSAYGLAIPGSVPFPVTINALLYAWVWVPAVGLLGVYLLLLFPDGRLPSRR